MKKINIMAVIVIIIALSGCGKRAALEAPPAADPNYPRQYPQPLPGDSK